jgi:CheY-like chemotaxis protein
MVRILVIDDDAAVRAVTCLILEGAGFTVAEASGGEEGIQAFRRRPADLIFCDMFMPDMDGLATIRQLRREFPDVRIVAMSGGGFGGGVDVLHMAELFGAAAVLHKPITKTVAMQAVNRVLEISPCRQLQAPTHHS